ncbi:hypothetical protein H0O02_04290 [Candidatus Micrarchaeota archaeon]|nr:hypothetical protein [Candidatus Micrarchaeota archaeon]
MDIIRLSFVFVLLAGFAYADVISPDEHPVTNNIYVDNIDEYPLYQFFIYPTSMGGGAAMLDSTKVPSFYKFAQPKLYAVEVESRLNVTAEGFVPPADALVSDTAFTVTSTLPNSDPRTSIDTHYRISIKVNRLTLAEVSPEPAEKGPDYAMFLAMLGVGLVIGYIAGKKL